MTPPLRALAFLLATGLVAAPGSTASAAAAGERLWLRYAVSTETPPTGEVPQAAAAYSREELLDRLMDWRPESDNPEIREVLRLRGLAEVARQASELPAGGGRCHGVFHVDGRRFDVEIEVDPAAESDVVTLSVEISRDGQLVSAPRIRVPLGDRASVASTGPGGSTLLLAIEVHRGELGDAGAQAVAPPLVDGERVEPPRLVHRVDARYPPEAKAAGVEGKVSLALVVGEDGRVRDVEVREGLPHGLSEAAVAAAEQWRFEPPRVAGKPAAVSLVYTIDFRLGPDRP